MSVINEEQTAPRCTEGQEKGRSGVDRPISAHLAGVDKDKRLPRRGFLTGAALAALFKAGVGTDRADAQVMVEAKRDADAHMAQTSYENWLINRLTWGINDREMELVTRLGPAGYIEHHLDYTNPDADDDADLDRRLRGYHTLDEMPYQLIERNGNLVQQELIFATILRSVYSSRQFFERMVAFWTDHFNIDINKSFIQFLKTVDDREVIRRHALGNFRDMLHASAKSPAMLVYLDNFTSVAGSPNENYARELLELHTLGADNGYTQKDVEEVARCFTGWTIHGQEAGELVGTFKYDRFLHDNGEKQVFGYTIPRGQGIRDGEIVIDILTTDPEMAPRTAQFVGGKLARWIWGYDPPQGLVDRVAETFLGTAGDIRAMVRTILDHPRDPNDVHAKYKRPYHLMVSALRALEADIASPFFLPDVLAALGQVPYYWPSPDGYPDALEFWAGLIMPRWNLGTSVMGGEIPWVNLDGDRLLDGAVTARELSDRLDEKFFGGFMPASDKNLIFRYLLPEPVTGQRIIDAFALTMGSPGFQWY